MTYGIELTQEQKIYTRRKNPKLHDYQIIEIIIKKICAMYELTWKDIFDTKRQDPIPHKVRALCMHVLRDYFGVSFISEMFSLNAQHTRSLSWKGKKIHLSDVILRATITSIHHDIKYNLPCN